MAGQATKHTREEICAKIKAVECNYGKKSSAPKMTLKTTSKQ
jgi:hypothetical protein